MYVLRAFGLFIAPLFFQVPGMSPSMGALAASSIEATQVRIFTTIVSNEAKDLRDFLALMWFPHKTLDELEEAFKFHEKGKGGFAIYKGKEVVGGALFTPMEIPLPNLFVQAVAVRPDYRRQGIGLQLLLAIDSLAHTLGALKIWLVVENENIAALRLYIKAGFICVPHPHTTARSICHRTASGHYPYL